MAIRSARAALRLVSQLFLCEIWLHAGKLYVLHLYENDSDTAIFAAGQHNYEIWRDYVVEMGDNFVAILVLLSGTIDS